MNAFSFLIDFVFDTYLMIVLLRVWLQLAKADFYNQLSQFVVKATNPLLAPMRRIIPAIGGLDTAGVVLAIIVAAAKFTALISLGGGSITMATLPILALVLVLKTAGTMVFWVMIIRAILSWVSQGGHPIEHLMAQLSEPLLAPIRRFMPALGGLDLSMIVLFVGLNFLNILLGQYIPFWAAL
ncbi:MAG: YggT family protein [Gammaproteobacteria bacterium]|nr:YggT family protein [Gammaproteobacteria bacterium]